MIRYMPIGDLSQPVSFAIPVKLEINLPVAQTPNCKWDDDMFDVLDAVMPVKCHLLARFLAETYDQELVREPCIVNKLTEGLESFL